MVAFNIETKNNLPCGRGESSAISTRALTNGLGVTGGFLGPEPMAYRLFTVTAKRPFRVCGLRLE